MSASDSPDAAFSVSDRLDAKSLGAVPRPNGSWSFRVWAPNHARLELVLLDPERRIVPLVLQDGYHSAHVDGLRAGARYWFRLPDGRELPDPASRHQPDGVHAPSALVDPTFAWTDADFRCPPFAELVLYELHVGTFTREGTFDAAIARLPELRELGINAVELMPLAQFPGERNWGYDGVFPFAVQASYGGPAGLQRFVDACHARGLAVFVDVVYNHLGPEGNYLAEYAPYFTDRYHTPWGQALNFDGRDSDHVRAFFLQSALELVERYHVDGFRLDAVHAIVDTSARPFLEELASRLHERGEELGRPVYVVAESSLNDPRMIRPPEQGGLGMDAQWTDDFQRALHALLTRERAGYYGELGSLDDLARAYRQGYVWTGQHSPFRRRRHGRRAEGCPPERFVVFSETHDTAGNRAAGERLACLVGLADLKLAACATLLSPFVPMLFMGQERGAAIPFQYFTSHSDPHLAEAVRRGRKREFRGFGWDPSEVPDPQDVATFERSKLPEPGAEGEDAARPPAERDALLALHRELLRLRREHPALGDPSFERTSAEPREDERALVVRRWHSNDELCLLLAFGEEERKLALELGSRRWEVLLDTEDARWGGGGARRLPELRREARIPLPPRSALVLARSVRP